LLSKTRLSGAVRDYVPRNATSSALTIFRNIWRCSLRHRLCLRHERNENGHHLDRALGARTLGACLRRSHQVMAIRVVAAAVLILLPVMARAQQQESAPPPATPLTIDPRDAADRRPSLVEPDFTLINLPTTLRLPRHKGAFRIAHRFTRTLNNPDFGALASNLFGLDSGALIGLEYRYGLMRGCRRESIGRAARRFSSSGSTTRCGRARRCRSR
jgi:hypothetical protein